MIEIVQADLAQPRHAGALLELLDAYARDPMGGGQPLSGFTRKNLVTELRKRSAAVSFLAFADGQPVGLVNCFEGFSTFRCRPLLNIHDVVVLDGYRGQGIARRLLERVEAHARERGCCKLTLEVLAGNRRARSVYQQAGFSGYELDPSTGQALFWEKSLE
ncbi:GNAT family acetyltransferase [Sedimenticola thiotaurini]|uniref:GNAT family acetyltransferase n=1 Tax=Sedimenticola thiotaurini TaxID=1543721 RepID=A0A0F7K3K9_9GAMM|nr:GNAT family N-acetyltransferase [Sedimenticola thiotaurini]AKH22094.1 GNAT family acetyltransferase [Sedimenticola thiotaurini]